MHSSSDESREVRHVDPEFGADFVGNLAEGGEVEMTRIRTPPRDEDLRFVLERLVANDVHVDEHRLGVESVGHGVVQASREVQLHSVGEVSAVRKLESKNCVVLRRNGVKNCGVCRCARVWLHIGVGRAEQRLCAFDGERFRNVDKLTTAVVPLAGVSLGVFIGQHRALNLQNRARNEVFRRDHFEVIPLTTEFELEDLRNFGVNL